MFHAFFYNLENFYIHPNSHDEDLLQFSKLKNWNAIRYEDKLQKINHLFYLFKNQYLRLPAIIGLCEFQGENVLESITNLSIFDGNYTFLCTQNSDKRGMKVGMLYDTSIVHILFSKSLSLGNELGARGYVPREILHCRCEIKKRVYDVFIVHLPSKRNKDENKSLRANILLELEKTVKHSLSQGYEVLLMGDFNQDFSTRSKDENWLTSFSDKLLFSFPTSFHHRKGIYVDAIFHFQPNENELMLLKMPISVFNTGFLTHFERKKIGEPLPTFLGTRYLGGVSDHFPVFSEIK
ncbi:hypothetical protein [Bergeyella zoohelcum]|uniref:endonuclease/exonuclease/phosphatase family protein n=1 Tax=Bergeyella zoohelcum TaxID=1015 RepID=UPI002A91056D|nr:hypothetical protein [Bergeyella zoohelcum]MDY6026108.1 hypothetical protein [Bergeyella zoohelcum]